MKWKKINLPPMGINQKKGASGDREIGEAWPKRVSGVACGATNERGNLPADLPRDRRGRSSLLLPIREKGKKALILLDILVLIDPTGSKPLKNINICPYLRHY